MDKDEIIKELAEENAKLKEELEATKEHFKKMELESFLILMMKAIPLLHCSAEAQHK